jgi:hypothetical protein
MYLSGCFPLGGFQVDSPVKKPDASEMPRSAPPHTFGAGEEPSGGGQRADFHLMPKPGNAKPNARSNLLSGVARLEQFRW